MNKNTLVSLFESNKSELASDLKGMSLPKDRDAIQSTVCDYLNNLFDKDGDFRMSLTQSEDYILNAALSLLNAQNEMGSMLKSSVSGQNDIEPEKEEPASDDTFQPKPMFETSNPFLKKTVSAPSALAGAGGGALLGHMISSGWGSVFGAIAGTAITIYLSTKNESISPKQQSPLHVKQIPASVSKVPVSTIDVDQFLEITRKICESVDNLIDTFRAQIRRVVDKYESQAKPSLEKEYSPILESIQTLVGYKRAHFEDEKYAKKVSERIEDLVEQVENYNLNVIDYDEANSSFFSFVTSSKTDTFKQAYPAIVKDGNVVFKGKVFVPEANDESNND